MSLGGSGGANAGRPEVLGDTPANESAASFSPDGRWVAYESNESGTEEIYVQRYPPGPGGKWQVSAGGGSSPIWSHPQRVLFFKSPDRRIMAAPYTADGDSFAAGIPKPWCDRPTPDSRLGADFDVASDGQRIAVQVLVPQNEPKGPARATFLLNFGDELRRTTAVK